MLDGRLWYFDGTFLSTSHGHQSAGSSNISDGLTTTPEILGHRQPLVICPLRDDSGRSGNKLSRRSTSC
uniref:Uncharacterized protein n=1 Tax=Arundo donax TaxID=35708 RepID=A0A0A9TZA4_ARUDO